MSGESSLDRGRRLSVPAWGVVRVYALTMENRAEK